MKAKALNELAIFALAVQFLTRIPVPIDAGYSPERLAATPRYYPLVGVLVGLACGLVYLLAVAGMTPLPALLLSIGTGLLLTGAFHEDGLADTFDGLGGLDREQSLSIMRDSRIGTYGALAMGLVLATKVAALLALAPSLVVLALVVAHAVSRLSAVLVIASSRYVREHGTGKPTANGIGAGGLTVALLSGALMLTPLAVYNGTAAAFYALAGALLGHLFMRALFERRLGGYTGDTLGAVQQLSELGVYLGLLLWQSS
ncbi:MAG: adenosylcobinamide-GDP ribazoletransferase [Pseudomonadota bacterium]